MNTNNDFYEKLILLKAIETDPYVIESASERMRNDKEVMMKVVKRSGYLLRYASPELQNDKDIIMEAVKNSITTPSLAFASDELKKDPEVINAAIKHDPYQIICVENPKPYLIEALNYNAKRKAEERIMREYENLKLMISPDDLIHWEEFVNTFNFKLECNF